MLKLRVDVDYAYPSRIKSFIYTYLGLKSKRQYLQYSKQLANLINKSAVNVEAYWFFNYHTLPDTEMLTLLSDSRHSIGLHVVNNAWGELFQLKEVSTKKTEYYTIHGTERLLGQIVWHRPLGQRQVVMPEQYPLKSFHDYPCVGLDTLCYQYSKSKVLELAQKFIRDGYVFTLHPEWLTCHGLINHRGPYIDVLSNLLF